MTKRYFYVDGKYPLEHSGKGQVHEPKMARQSLDDPGIAFSSQFDCKCDGCGGCFAEKEEGATPSVWFEHYERGEFPQFGQLTDPCFFNIPPTTCTLIAQPFSSFMNWRRGICVN